MKTVLNPGTYWIGDISFAFPNPTPDKDPWEDVLQQTGFFHTSSYFKNDHLELWADFAAQGTGQYLSSCIVIFPVESRLIGIISESSLDYLKSNREELDQLGMFITFHEPFEVFKENGVFYIGPIEIDTTSETHFSCLNSEEDEE